MCDKRLMKKFSNKKKPRNKGFIDIYGFHAVKAALKNSNRNHEKLTISQSYKDFVTVEIQKKVKNIIKLSSKEMLKLYGSENTHQGLVLTTSNLNQPNLDEILDQSKNKKVDLVVMLDQVTDPYNIGSIMRSCSLFNCKSIIITKNNAPNVTPSMAKAASGALEIINYIKVTNLSQAIAKFKKNNFWIYGLDNNKNNLDNNFELPQKCLFIFGAEGKGLRNKTKKECDEIISIPMNSNSIYEIDSFNVSNACSIILYEHFKMYNC